MLSKVKRGQIVSDIL